MRLVKILTLAMLIAGGRVAVADENAEWEVEIVPRETVAAGASGEVVQSYDAIYDRIPFSRAEWLANPSYRHDSTMAVLTGQPVTGRTPPVAELQRYADPRPYMNTFFPRLSPADLHYKYTYGWLWYRPYGVGTGWFRY